MPKTSKTRKSNKAEPKDKGGAPAKFDSKEKLAKAIAEYLKICSAKKTKQMPNKAGLRLHLDISRETYNQYRKRFPDTIKKADDYIETAWVQRLAGNAATGAIFYLKNAYHEDYKDRHAIDPLKGSLKITFDNAFTPGTKTDSGK